MSTTVRRRWRRLTGRGQDERGATLLAAAGGILALTSVAALAVDVGMMTVARSEAQRVADLAALAGAGAFIQSPGNETLARRFATEFAARNTVRHSGAVVLEEDIRVDTDLSRVTVFVNRTSERGNPVGTFFARVFGVGSVDVSAMATAEATNAGGINCLLPVAVPDRWREAGGSGNDPSDYNEEYGDEYVPWVQPGTDPIVYNPDATGYGESDLGEVIALKSNTGGGGMNPSWYYPWRPFEQAGAEDFRTNIWNCVDPSQVFGVGVIVDTEPGNMAGPTMQGFQDLLDQDPSASWNPSLGCVVDRGLESAGDARHCRGSPRIRPVPLFDPREEPDPGNKPFQFTNFAGIFVESIQGKTVYARWMGYTALRPASPGETTAGPLFKVLRLIE